MHFSDWRSHQEQGFVEPVGDIQLRMQDAIIEAIRKGILLQDNRHLIWKYFAPSLRLFKKYGFLAWFKSDKNIAHPCLNGVSNWNRE